MRVDFKRFKFASPGLPPTVTWRPLLPVAIVNPVNARSQELEAVVDSGAPMCVFPASVAEAIGIDVKGGIQGSNDAGDSQPIEALWAHKKIKIMVRDPNGMIYEIETTVGFSYGQRVALLGQIGFFECFKVTFDHSTQPPHFELERIERKES
jgi:hypothetical protein